MTRQLQLLHQILLRLLAGGCQREAEAMAGGLAAAACLLPAAMTRLMSDWALEACQEAPEVLLSLSYAFRTPACLGGRFPA